MTLGVSPAQMTTLKTRQKVLQAQGQEGMVVAGTKFPGINATSQELVEVSIS